MRAKAKYEIPIKFLVIFNLLSWYRFFYIIPFSGILDNLFKNYNLVVINALIGFVIGLYYLRMHNTELLQFKKWLSNYYLVLMISYGIELLYTIVKYPAQSIITGMRFGSNFIQLFWVPIYLVLFIKDGGIKKTFEAITIISFIWNLIVLFQRYIYIATGSFLFDFASRFNDGAVASRLYGIRVGMGALGGISILYNFSLLYSKTATGRNKRFKVIQLLLSFYCLLFIQQTRMWIIVIAASIITQIVAGNKTMKTRVFEVFMVVLFSAILYFSGSFSSFISNMIRIEQAEGNASSYGRQYELRYFWECFIHNPIFGNGFVSSEISSPYFTVEHGELGIAYYSDMGIIALLAETGVFSIVFYIIPFFKIVKCFRIISIKKSEMDWKYPFLFSTISYLLFSSITLIITANGLVVAFPIIVAAFMIQEKELLVNKHDYIDTNN